MSKKNELTIAPRERNLITDAELAAELGCGMTACFEIQKAPGFPDPLWLGQRMKRHDREKIRAWAATRRKAA